MLQSNKTDKLSFKRLQKKEINQQFKETIQTYMCVCGKQYMSFPALYLHNKKKHDLVIKLEDRNKMNRKIKWSGAKKKITYQLNQASDLEEMDQKSEKQERNVKPSTYIQPKYDELDRNQSRKKVSYNNIDSIFNLYCQSEIEYIHKNSEKEIITTVIKEFQNCLNSQYQRIFQTSEKFLNFTSQNSPSCLPLSFNYFIVKYMRKKQFDEQQLKQIQDFLLQFSAWLYKLCLSPYLAALNT